MLGLDVSLRLTAICVLDERGRVLLEGKVRSKPTAIADFLQPYAPTLKLAGLEAGLGRRRSAENLRNDVKHVETNARLSFRLALSVAASEAESSGLPSSKRGFQHEAERGSASWRA
jgi:hypothetical protein